MKEKSKSLTCFYCGIYHPHVEAQGMLYCPNALCSGPGGSWFRSKLDSYEEINSSEHTVKEDEWLKKGIINNKNNGIERDYF
jgi:hypothetical protein